MVIFLSVCILLIIALCFYSIKWGLAVYVCWYILVPFNQIQFGNFGLGANFVNTLILFAFVFNWYKYKKKWRGDIKILLLKKNPLAIILYLKSIGCGKWQFYVFMPFLMYYGTFFVFIFFQNETPLGWQLNYWRQNMMQTLLLPMYLWHIMQWDASSISLFRKSFFFIIALSSIYGIMLMPLHGFNPYIMYIQMIKGEEYQIGYALAEGSGRMFGRISSCFTHPMAYGLFLGLSFFFVLSYRKKINDFLYLFLLLLLSVNVVVCGVRSSLGALGVTMLFYLIQNGEAKLILKMVLMGLFGIFIILQIPELSDYVISLVDLEQKHTSVGGSSFEMRISQLEGALSEISNSPILGKGFGWHLYYIEKFGDHPILLAFESLFFVVLCDNGVLGIIIWFVFICLILRSSKTIVKKSNDCNVIYALLVFYFVYCCFTGEYNYMRLFLLFYVILIAEKKYTNSKTKVKINECSLV